VADWEMLRRLQGFRGIAAGFALSLLASAASAQTSQLLRDFHPGTTSTLVTFGPGLNGIALFAADDGTGIALWRSDGTPSGTQRLGGGASLTVSTGPVGAQLGSVLVYTGYTAAGNAELWRTDGTAAGTYLLLDLSASSNLVGNPGFGAIPPGSNPANCGAGFVVMGSHAFYGAAGSRLFRTDGTVAGTVQLAELSSVCALAASGGSVYFQAMDTVTAAPLLWRSNGQPGGHERVLDDTRAPMPAPFHMVEMGGSLYFFSRVRNQYGLWRLTPGDPVARLVLPRTWSSFSNLPVTNAVVGNVLLFRDADEVNGIGVVPRMYRTDGTAGGTYALSSVQGASSARPFGAPSGNRFFYTGPVDMNSFDLWVTDGTAAGTTSIRMSMPGDQTFPTPEFFVFNGQMHFMVNRTVSNISHTELWRSDGTSAGTVRITEVPLISRTARGAAHYAIAGNRLLFVGESDIYGEEPWFYEPAVGGTPGSGGSVGGGGGSGGGAGSGSDGGGGAVLWPQLLALGLLLARRQGLRIQRKAPRRHHIMWKR